MHLCLVVVGALYILFYDYDYEIRRDIEKYYTHLFTILMSVVYCLHRRSRISSRCQSHSCSTAAHLAKFGCPNVIPGWRMLGPKNLGTLRTVAGPCSTVKHASSLKELLCKIWSFDVKRCGGVGTILKHLGAVRQTVRACGPVEP